jgi:uncharacterized protein (TIGR02270 family)
MEMTKIDSANTQSQKIYRPEVTSVIEQHVEEAAFCWLRREDALWQPSISFNQFNRFDQRLDAHMEGLRLAGDAAWPYALQRMNRWKTVDEVFAGSYLAIQLGDEEKLNAVTKIAQQNPNTVAGIAAALDWTTLLGETAKATQAIQFFWQQDDTKKSATIDSAIKLAEINTPKILLSAANSSHSGLRYKALTAIGDHQLIECKTILHDALHDQDQKCKLAAAQSLALLGESQHQSSTLGFISQLQGNEWFKRTLVWCVTSSAHDFNNWLTAQTNITVRNYIWVNAFRGDSHALNRLASLLENLATAPLAAYAIQHITGINMDDIEDATPYRSNDSDDESKEHQDPLAKQLKRESEGLTVASSAELKNLLSQCWDTFNTGEQFLNGAPIYISSLALDTSCSMPQHWHQSLIKTLDSHSPDWAEFPKPLFTR